MNMGTPGYPEGLEHWANKVMLFNKLKEWQKTQRPFNVFFELGGFAPKCPFERVF